MTRVLKSGRHLLFQNNCVTSTGTERDPAEGGLVRSYVITHMSSVFPGKEVPLRGMSCLCVHNRLKGNRRVAEFLASVPHTHLLRSNKTTPQDLNSPFYALWYQMTDQLPGERLHIFGLIRDTCWFIHKSVSTK